MGAGATVGGPKKDTPSGLPIRRGCRVQMNAPSVTEADPLGKMLPDTRGACIPTSQRSKQCQR